MAIKLFAEKDPKEYWVVYAKSHRFDSVEVIYQKTIATCFTQKIRYKITEILFKKYWNQKN